MKINTMDFRFFLLMIFISSSISLFGQGQLHDPFTIPKYIPKSPEVASFQRYGDIPVSLYTGVPDISIPIHTVNMKNMEVPINLSYHAGGITVNQEATFVGLGWTLFAGGTITLTPVGNRDLNIFTTSPWQGTLEYYANLNTMDMIFSATEGKGKNNGCSYPFTNPEVDPGILSNAALDYGEQDIYNVTLPNRSFKFIIHPETGEPFFVGEKNKCIIDISGYQFTIVDENGITYLFEDFEEGGQPVLPNSWYLTSMTDVYGNTVQFEYESYGGIYEQGTGFHEGLKFGYPSTTNPVRYEGSGNTSVNNLYLTSIRTNLEEVVFKYSNEREDISGDGAMRLDSIVVKNTSYNKRLKKYLFNYGYFDASTVGGNFATDTDNSPPEPSDYLKKRLKLEKVSKVNPYDDTDFHSYDFTYHEDNMLPLKTTFAKDFWGYYNGQENASHLYTDIGHTLIPNPRVMAYMLNEYVDFVDTHPEFEFDDCANRFTHSEFIKTATIKSITYPTGGRTDFEFEPHVFYNEDFISAEDYEAFEKVTSAIAGVSDMNDPYGYSIISQPFILTESRAVRLEGGINKTSFPSYDLSSSTIGIVSISGGGSQLYNFQDQDFWDLQIDLEPGEYRLVCSAPANVPFNNYSVIVYANLYNNYFDEDAINEALNKTSIGGGLRISKIYNYDSNDDLISTKEFLYVKEDGTTSGKLMKRPYNYKEERLVRGDQYQHPVTLSLITSVINENYRSLLSDNILPIYNSTNSANVTYDRVIVRQISDTHNNGSEITYYSNELPRLETWLNFNFYDKCTNGNIQKKIFLAYNDDTVRVEKYNYNQYFYDKAWVNIKAIDRLYATNTVCLAYFFTDPSTFMYDVTAYASTNFINKLYQLETFDYYPNGIVSSMTENFYDENTYQIKQSSVHTDKGIRKTVYQYPTDDPDYLSHTRMLENNWISPIIEQREYMDDKLLKTTNNNFWFYHNFSMVALHDINVGFGNETPETKVVFENYDLNGNVKDLHKPNDASITYIWSYNDQYPIIKALNIDQNTLNSEITGVLQTYFGGQTLNDFITGLSDMIQISNKTTWESFNDKLRSAVPWAMISAYTYDPLLGITSEADPNGITTYFEYDEFNRLKLIKDEDGNIVQHYQYHYKGQ